MKRSLFHTASIILISALLTSGCLSIMVDKPQEYHNAWTPNLNKLNEEIDHSFETYNAEIKKYKNGEEVTHYWIDITTAQLTKRINNLEANRKDLEGEYPGQEDYYNAYFDDVIEVSERFTKLYTKLYAYFDQEQVPKLKEGRESLNEIHRQLRETHREYIEKANKFRALFIGFKKKNTL